MNRTEIFDQIKKKRSFLCIGLDTDFDRIPDFLKQEKDPIFEFNKRIIDATKNYCVAYKPNIAFYEALGSKGWEALEKTLDYIPDNIFTIAACRYANKNIFRFSNSFKLSRKNIFKTIIISYS